MFWWVIWWHDGQSKRPLRQDKHGHYFLISHLLFVLQYFYHNFESCCWTIYTNRKIILHDVFVQLQRIFNSTNINHGQSYPIFGFWLKLHNQYDTILNPSHVPYIINVVLFLYNKMWRYKWTPPSPSILLYKWKIPLTLYIPNHEVLHIFITLLI